MLVTGGAGFIGSALARRLIHDGHAVRVVDNLVNGDVSSIPPEAEFLEADVLDTDALHKACVGVDAVFHQAAIRSVPRSIDDPLATHNANATGTLSVLIAASSQKIRRFVYASSSSVYGGQSDEAATEDLPPSPRSPYAVSKLTGEYYCRVWSSLGQLSTVSLRYFNVFGPGQHPESRYSAVFPAFIQALRQGTPPEVNWDGEQSRDFTFVDDVVEANVRAAFAGAEAGGHVLNIAGGASRTINETLRAVAAAVGTWIDPVYSEKRPGDVRMSRADISRARAVIGWEPAARWETAVQRTVEWFDDESV